MLTWMKELQRRAGFSSSHQSAVNQLEGPEQKRGKHPEYRCARKAQSSGRRERLRWETPSIGSLRRRKGVEFKSS